MDSNGERKISTRSKKRDLLFAAMGLGVLAPPILTYLWTSHKDHILGLLPWALVLLCPIMHLFLHGKHGKGH
ncbi:MAG: DUF2933 domain-containing protein [bacterium]|nr:MAG: DUF2933 domain-containing protein [bacterium]